MIIKGRILSGIIIKDQIDQKVILVVLSLLLDIWNEYYIKFTNPSDAIALEAVTSLDNLLNRFSYFIIVKYRSL